MVYWYIQITLCGQCAIEFDIHRHKCDEQICIDEYRDCAICLHNTITTVCSKKILLMLTNIDVSRSHIHSHFQCRNWEHYSKCCFENTQQLDYCLSRHVASGMGEAQTVTPFKLLIDAISVIFFHLENIDPSTFGTKEI